MSFFRKITTLLANTPLLIFLLIIMGIYVVGLISQQHILISTIESYKNAENTHKNEVALLKKEITSQSEYFIPDKTNECLKKNYALDRYIISSTSNRDWCNVRVFTSTRTGFDILFPSIATLELREDLAVFDDRSGAGITLFTIHEALAEGKSVSTYDSIIEKNGNSTIKLINDPIISKKVIEVHEVPVLSITTQDAAGRVSEHFIFDNGLTEDKKVYRITFYNQLAESDKEIILNSFAPRF